MHQSVLNSFQRRFPSFIDAHCAFCILTTRDDRTEYRNRKDYEFMIFAPKKSSQLAHVHIAQSAVPLIFNFRDVLSAHCSSRRLIYFNLIALFYGQSFSFIKCSGVSVHVHCACVCGNDGLCNWRTRITDH